MKKILTLAVVMVFLAIAVGVAQYGDSPVSDNLQATDTQRAVFQVDNMTCSACFTKINEGLSSLGGFAGMGGNMLRKQVAVDFLAPLTPEDIQKTIAGLGFPATLNGVESLEENQTFAYMSAQKQGGGFGGGCCNRGGCRLSSADASEKTKGI